jgi:hypothetical protein
MTKSQPLPVVSYARINQDNSGEGARVERQLAGVTVLGLA